MTLQSQQDTGNMINSLEKNASTSYECAVLCSTVRERERVEGKEGERKREKWLCHPTDLTRLTFACP